MQIILLLAILGGITLLLVQNWSPVLPLVFLGLTTPALPLAVWILISLAAGGSTALAIASLFRLTNYFAQPKPSKKRQVKPPPSSQPSSNRSTKRHQDASSNSDPTDDWLDDPLNDEDWHLEENKEDSDKNENTDSYPQDSRSYEVNSEPKTSKRQGSVYSYSYREPESSGVGKSESVYDADYRVLTPPYRSPNPVQDNDDWGFDDEFEDEQDDLRSPRQ